MTTQTFDATGTAALLDYVELVAALRVAITQYAGAEIVSPERLVVPLQAGGVMLSMPSSAADMAIHKLVNVCPQNGTKALPTIHGQVIACDAVTGEMLFVLDGPTVTGRRTAAVTMLGIQTFYKSIPNNVLIVGTGTQAVHHVHALAAAFPQTRIYIKGRSQDSARHFVRKHVVDVPELRALESDVIPDEMDVVVTVTTSKSPVYTSPARVGRLVIGVGAFTPDAAELGQCTVDSSYVVVDDPFGARHEAGDLIQAGIDWTTVASMAQALDGTLDITAPVLLKTVGCAAWDLAACRVAKKTITARIGQ